MKNKIIAAILSAFVCVAFNPGISYAQEIQDNEIYEDLEYIAVDDNNDGTDDYIEITGCNKNAVSVTIPPEIDGLPVEAISSYGLSNMKYLENITIPDTVKVIKYSAFSGCPLLESIIIPDGVTEIEYRAFSSNDSLKSAVIPDSVKKIGDGAFSYCPKLIDVTIPETLTDIGSAFLGNTAWLKEKKSENPLVIVNSVLIDGRNCGSTVVIPDGVTAIAGYAFAGDKYTNVNPEIVKIPDSVKKIGDGAFSYCKITDVEIPASVESVGSAFSYCCRLKNINILNPECEIKDEPSAISYGTTGPWEINGTKPVYYFEGIIHGYKGSTAQAYAEKYGYSFSLLNENGSNDPEPPETESEFSTESPVVTSSIKPSVTTTTTTTVIAADDTPDTSKFDVPLSGIYNLTVRVADIITEENINGLECELFNYQTGEIIASWSTTDEPEKYIEGLEYSFDSYESYHGNITYFIRIPNMPEEYLFFYGKMRDHYGVAGSSIFEFLEGTEVDTTVYLIDTSDDAPEYTYVTSSNAPSATTTTTTVIVTDDTNVTDNEVTVVKGDVSGDGSVNVADVVLLQQYLIKKIDSISETADLNGDSKIDAFDLIMLKRMIMNN